MAYKFGFELEGFFETPEGQLQLPPVNYPTDGFPGLCEVRTVGGLDLEDAYFMLLNQFRMYPFNASAPIGKFPPDLKRRIRARQNVKDSVIVSNIYGKEPKELGDKTIASFQINISNQVSPKTTRVEGTSIHTTEARYGLFDYVPIIRALDKEFAAEIADAKRQPGFYALKDDKRIEYRSLPNSVFKTDLNEISVLLKRIRRCMYNKF